MYMKKILSIFLTVVMFFAAALPIYAQGAPSQKEEVVYGILNMDGSVNSIYVVNIFNAKEITDYGSYTEVHNLITSERLKQTGDQINITTTADKLYYQGTLETKELPWKTAITYKLDGKELPASDLVGKSGALEISISVVKNEKTDSAFYDNFALQITLAMDTKLCKDIKAGSATIADAGSKKQISYTVLPGNGADIKVTADVHNFEMDPITINGIKLALDFNLDTGKFTGQLTQLTDALKGLDNGAGELLSAAAQLSAGMEKYIAGLKAFESGLTAFSGGADKLNSGAVALSSGLSELTKQNSTLVNGALTLQQATFDSVNAQLSSTNLGLPVLTPQNYSAVLSGNANFASIKAQLDGIVQFAEGLKGYTDGVAQLGSGASDLASGTTQLKTSAATLAASANELYNAGVGLNTGIKQLRDGLVAYKDGTKSLRSGTSDLDTEIDGMVDDILSGISGDDGQVHSFVSVKNTDVTAVQFVLKTGGIEAPEVQKPAPQTVGKLTFWQRLLKLFGL